MDTFLQFDTEAFLPQLGVKMQKLKDYLSTLIEAVFGNKTAFIASQAMPDQYRLEVYTGTESINEGKYVAPSSGYVSIDNYGTERSYIQGDLLSYITHSDRAAIFLPVKKGQHVTYSAEGEGEKRVRFWYLTGGGGLTDFCCWLRRGFGEVQYA